MYSIIFDKYRKIYRGDDMSNEYLDPIAVGEAISYCRRSKNVSQEVLSGLADIGRTHLSAIERGARKPTLETLYRISIALDMKMSDIVQEIEKRI
jgi:transcriptional regulator with XRE-family HTH domain